MPDKYDHVRSLSFPALAAALGLDINNYRQRKHGQEYYGPCPIHHPKQNSTSFSYASDGRFNCFSCNAKGKGAIDLVKLVRGVGFQAAVELLGAVPAEEPSKQKSPVLSDSGASGEVIKPLEKDTWSKFKVPSPWLEQRIQDAEVRARYAVFCYNNPARKSAYSGRVMIPVKDVAGVLYGYLGRDTGTANSPVDTPKYLFPKNLPKSQFLFGAHELVSGIYGPVPLKRVYLVESPFCVMKFAMYGLPAVACFGWSYSQEQLQLLTDLCKGVVYLPDRNKRAEAGQHLQMLSERLWLRFPLLPDGVDDPEQLSHEAILAL